MNFSAGGVEAWMTYRLCYVNRGSFSFAQLPSRKELARTLFSPSSVRQVRRLKDLAWLRAMAGKVRSTTARMGGCVW